MAKELTDKEMEAQVMQDALRNYWVSKGIDPDQMQMGNQPVQQQQPVAAAQPTQIPDEIKMPDATNLNPENFEKSMMTETDPDLIVTYEIVKLPSEGRFYPDGLKEVEIEYLTTRDEDLLTTPSFIEDGTVIDRLLERKIVTKNVNPRNLLAGDRSALILFLRTSSYGQYYKVNVPDPRSGKSFEAEVDLLKLRYKDNTEFPDQNGEFSVEIPMRKKLVKFRLLNVGQEDMILKNAEARKEAYGAEVSEFNTMRLKAAITEIGGMRDQSYIDRFVDAMPALDAFTIRRKILDVAPEVEMSYEFKAPDGYKFTAPLSMGIDFFFPSL